MHTPHVLSGGRYPVLRSLAILYLIGAAVFAAAGIVAAGWTLMRAPAAMPDRVVMAIGALAAAFFIVISMLAIAEVLKLFIDVEHNTRMAAAEARQQVMAGPTVIAGDGGMRAPNRLDALDEETAEAALVRGH